jgi:hypothetical protein
MDVAVSTNVVAASVLPAPGDDAAPAGNAGAKVGAFEGGRVAHAPSASSNATTNSGPVLTTRAHTKVVARAAPTMPASERRAPMTNSASQ